MDSMFVNLLLSQPKATKALVSDECFSKGTLWGKQNVCIGHLPREKASV